MSDGPLAELLSEFMSESEERIGRLEQLLLDLPAAGDQQRENLVRRARRELHTLKGNAGMMGLESLQRTAHRLEDATDGLTGERPAVEPLLTGLDELRAGLRELRGAGEPGDGRFAAGGGVRISYSRLDEMIDRLAAQLQVRHRLSAAIGEGRAAANGDDRQATAWQSCQEAWNALDRMLEDLQQEVLALRMVPVSTILGGMRRVVHDEAERAGKQVRFEARGGTTSVDRTLIDAAADVLGHLVRNSVVHGIETPARRRRAGKPPTGIVRVEAAVRSDKVQLDVLDDGAGIDLDRLRAAAEQRGIKVPEDDVEGLLFHAGLSTRVGADLSAGRGVGMDVVLDAVRRCGGTIEVATRKGVGTRFRLSLPLSVSIARAMLLAADGREYALPVSAILETLRLPSGGQRQALEWRGRELPLLDLGRCFGTRTEARPEGFVVVISAGSRLRGLVVDATRGPLEIMVKGLDDLLHGLPGVGGSTVLGDGRVVLILDAQALTALEPTVGAAA